MFWKNFYNICQLNNTSPNAVCAELGLSTATATHWKNGTLPKADVLVKIADYFDLPLDYLLGRTNTITETNSHNTISGNNNIVGNGNTAGEHLSDQEKALLDIFKKINVVKQAQLLAYAAELEKEV